jgi:hypothetical protein
MTLSRKRQKELRRLKRSAEDLWDEQRETLEHAQVVLREARRQAMKAAKLDLVPKLREGAEAVGGFAGTARERFTHDVLPAVTGALGSALAAIEAAKHPGVREVAKKVSKAGAKAGVVTPPKSSGPGKYILIGLGVVAFASIAYAAWQTLRADDDLWIEDLGDPGSADVGDDDL